MKEIFVLPTVALLLLSSCGNTDAPPIKDAETIEMSPIQKTRVSQENDFAFDLMKQTLADTDDGNVFISPLSVSIALGMARNGAIGDTKKGMETTLKMRGMTNNEINAFYNLLLTELPEIDKKTKLSIANSIWYRNTFPVKSDFLNVNADYFKSEVSALDFNSPSAVKTINQWCSDKTNGLIPEVINEINPLQMMFLINAVYFKGIWVKQFDKKNTVESNFYAENGQTSRVNMMNLTDTFAYAEDDYAQYLDMPYGNKAFSMTVILPKGTDSEKPAFGIFDKTRFDQAVSQQKEQKVVVQFPRLQVKNKFQLKPMLTAMGMEKAFQENAEFDGISDLKPLYIGFVQHDTFVEVTEEGTEAAAVTTIGIETTSIPVIPYFTVNKPFGFVIREKSTGVILFMGKMGEVKKF
ncbi:MAG: serpin family protein [Paludibacteraceae bacterium]